jgi:hypothetical protein
MSNYINIRTGEFPVHEGDIRLVHPEIGKEFMCPDGYAPVEEATPPIFDEMTQRLLVTAQRNGDRWVMAWSIQQKSTEETEALRLAIESYNNPTQQNISGSGSEPDVIG